MIENLQALIRDKTKLKLGINKINELSRLVYEIGRRENIPFEKVLETGPVNEIICKESAGYLAKFAGLKKYLLARRYPNASKQAGIKAYFSRLKDLDGTAKVYGGKFRPENIYVEEAARNSALAQRLKALYPEIKVQSIKNLKTYRKQNPGSGLDPKKRDIFVALRKWDLIKPCPCTKNVVACGYHIINIGFGCPYDCSYCYLQQYANFPGIILDSDISAHLVAAESYIQARPGRKIRVGTGEFADSLALDHITEYSKELVPFFAGQNAVLELKTKSDNIGNLLGLEHKGNTVISWSLNPQVLANTEEIGAASLAQRLEAAKKCAAAGYGIGFHFDPVIHYEGWEKDYKEVVNAMFDAVKYPAWISIGALRFHRTLKDVIEQRFPGSGYIYGELALGEDNKMRYYQGLRKDIFDKMSGWIKQRNQNSLVYLCMEDAEMWSSVLGRKAF